MWLWGVTASFATAYVLPRPDPCGRQKPGHTRPNHQRFREHSLLLTAFAAQSTLKAHRALKAHTSTPRHAPERGRWWRLSGARGGRRQAGYSPPVCCIINW